MYLCLYLSSSQFESGKWFAEDCRKLIWNNTVRHLRQSCLSISSQRENCKFAIIFWLVQKKLSKFWENCSKVEMKECVFIEAVHFLIVSKIILYASQLEKARLKDRESDKQKDRYIGR